MRNWILNLAIWMGFVATTTFAYAGDSSVFEKMNEWWEAGEVLNGENKKVSPVWLPSSRSRWLPSDPGVTEFCKSKMAQPENVPTNAKLNGFIDVQLENKDSGGVVLGRFGVNCRYSWVVKGRKPIRKRKGASRGTPDTPKQYNHLLPLFEGQGELDVDTSTINFPNLDTKIEEILKVTDGVNLEITAQEKGKGILSYLGMVPKESTHYVLMQFLNNDKEIYYAVLWGLNISLEG